MLTLEGNNLHLMSSSLLIAGYLPLLITLTSPSETARNSKYVEICCSTEESVTDNGFFLCTTFIRRFRGDDPAEEGEVIIGK